MNTQTHILILEDNPLDVDLFIKRLEQADLFFEYRHVDKRKHYIQQLKSFEPDLILSDFKLPDINGFEAIQLNEKTGGKDIPLIIISGAIGEENAADVIKAGAKDYVSKDHPERLPLAVKRALGEQKEQMMRREAEAQAGRLERRLGYLFSNSLDGILFIRGNGEILGANPAACEMLGYSRSEITRMNRDDLVDKEKSSSHELNVLSKSEGEYRGKLEFLCKDGSTLPVEISINFEEENGELEGGYAIFRDISLQREYETRLKKEKDLQSLLKDIGLIVNNDIDTDGALEQCTRLICDFLDWQLGHIYLANGITGEMVSSDIWHTRETNKYREFINDTTRRSFKLDEGLLGEVYRSREVRWVPNLEEANNYKRTLVSKKSDLKSALVFPVIGWGETVAVMEFYAAEEQEYDTILEQQVGMIGKHIGQLLERKIARDLMEEKERMFRLLAKNSTDMISRHKPDGTILYVSPASENMFGYTPGELIGTNIIDYVHPDDIPDSDYESEDSEYHDVSTIFEQDYRFKTNSGEFKWVETKQKTLFDPTSGESLELQASTRDISERVEAEYEVKRHRQLLQSMMDQSEAVIYVKEKNGSFRFVNQSFLDLFGKDEDEVIGKRDVDIMAEEYVEPMRESDLKALETGDPVELEESVEINGEMKIFLSIKVPLENVEGFENCVCGISTDITDRKKIEENIKNTLLEKQTLLMEIHHRVKNNLAVISGMMQLQAFRSENSKVVDELMSSQSRIKSMALIHELLYESESFSDLKFNENIRKIVNHITNSFPVDKNIELQLDLEPVELNVNQAIPCALILNELLINGYKYAFKGRDKGRIELRMNEKNNTIEIEIIDDGVGLPDDFKIKNSETLGMKLVDVLRKQLKADLNYTTGDSGTRFILTFKKKVIKGPGNVMF